MNKNKSIDILKQAFEEGFNAFYALVQNERGQYQNPHNPYPPKGLPHKEWERGYNAGYFKQQKVQHV